MQTWKPDVAWWLEICVSGQSADQKKSDKQNFGEEVKREIKINICCKNNSHKFSLMRPSYLTLIPHSVGRHYIGGMMRNLFHGQ